MLAPVVGALLPERRRRRRRRGASPDSAGHIRADGRRGRLAGADRHLLHGALVVALGGDAVAGPLPVAGGAAPLAAPLLPGRAAGGRLLGLGLDDPPLGGRVDAQVVEQVLRGRVRLLRLLEGQPQRVVDDLPPRPVGPVHEGDRDPGGARTPGAPDAVHVGLVVLGALVVDHVRHVGDVDAAGGDVGGHEDVGLTAAEALQRLLPQHLGEVAVDRGGAEAALGEVVGDSLRRPLRAAEDHHPVAVLGLQDAGHDLGLVEVVRLIDELGRRRHRRGVLGGLGADVDRVPQVPPGQRDDGGRHGRREEHRLAELGGLGEDALDVGQEAQVEHLVGLVQHEHLDVAEVQGPTVGQVEQPARRADDDLDAVGQCLQLGLVAHPAVQGDDAGVALGGRDREVLADLAGQLTRRGDDQRLRGARLGQRVEVALAGDDDALQQRDAERQRLAGAGARLADHVGAGQGDRDGHRLDRERVADADRVEGVGDGAEHPEVVEGLRQRGRVLGLGGRLGDAVVGGEGGAELVGGQRLGAVAGQDGRLRLRRSGFTWRGRPATSGSAARDAARSSRYAPVRRSPPRPGPSRRTRRSEEHGRRPGTHHLMRTRSCYPHRSLRTECGAPTARPSGSGPSWIG